MGPRTHDPGGLKGFSLHPPIPHLLGPVLEEPLRSLGPWKDHLLSQAPGGAASASRRREARRTAARERFSLARLYPLTSIDPGAPGSAEADDRVDVETRAEGGDEGERVVLVPLQILFEQFVLNVPYDEAPMRVYELSEV